MRIRDFKSLYELFEVFPDEQSCIRHLETQRWGDAVVSPFDRTSKVYKCKGNMYRCRNTGKYFNAKTGTLFESTKIKLRKWFAAIWLITSHKKGISSYQLARDIDVTQKTAWFMLHRLRESLGISNDVSEDNLLEGTVEVDETFVGGKNKNRHRDKKAEACRGRSFKDKAPVFGMIQRGGRVITRVVKDTKAQTLFCVIKKCVKRGSKLYTDEWNYSKEADRRYEHRHVNHGTGFYGSGDLTTNHIEGFWALVKRGIMGIYYRMSRKHLQRYMDEYTFRYNTRGMAESERFNFLLRNSGHRLTYKQLVHNGKEDKTGTNKKHRRQDSERTTGGIYVI